MELRESLRSERRGARWGIAVVLAILGAGCRPATEPADGPEAGAPASASGPGTRVIVDGSFDDWRDATPVHADAVGDGAGLDLGRLWLAHDERFLFLSFEVGAEIQLKEGNTLVLYLDTDDDPDTGIESGAELVWRFGEQSGAVARGAAAAEVGHAAISLVTAPTVSSNRFEMAVDRAAVGRAAIGRAAIGRAAVGRAAAWRLVLADERDRLPDRGQIRYALDDPLPPPARPRGLERKDPRALRLLTYNVERDGLFDPDLRPSYARILTAVAPDLLGLQEVYAHDAEAARSLVAETLPAPAGGRWHAAKVGLDLVAVSRDPILRAECITYCDDYGSTGAFLIDARETLGRRLLLVVAHPPCCTGGDPPFDEQRQYVIDATMAYLRDARRPGGAIEVAEGTPIVIAGDMNLVGDRRQLHTLLTGEIVHTAKLGPVPPPDWDGTALADLRPLHTDLPMAFTWFQERGSFSPGRLDFIVYSDSVLRATHSYVLFTPAMSYEALAASGLEREDTSRASDHLPVVADFVVR